MSSSVQKSVVQILVTGTRPDFTLTVCCCAAGRESVVLLKNEKRVLPLDGTSLSSLVLMGDCSNSLRFQTGGWSFHWQVRSLCL